MSELTVIAHITTDPAKTDRFIEIFGENVINVHEEPGCLHYTLHRDQDHPEKLVVVERWASAAALAEHAAAPHMNAMREQAAGMSLNTEVLRFDTIDCPGMPEKSNL